MKPLDDIQHRFLYELGEGSYGVVYLAEDNINGGRLAVKIPRPNDQLDLSMLERSPSRLARTGSASRLGPPQAAGRGPGS